MTLGERFKNLRQLLGLNQDKAAEIMGISSSYLSEIERDIKIPSYARIELIAEAYCIPVWVLFFPVDDGIKVELPFQEGYEKLKKMIQTSKHYKPFL